MKTIQSPVEGDKSTESQQDAPLDQRVDASLTEMLGLGESPQRGEDDINDGQLSPEESAGDEKEPSAEQDESNEDGDGENDADAEKHPKWFQKRIDKFTRKLRETEAKLTENQKRSQQLEEEISKLKSDTPKAAPTDATWELDEEKLDREADEVQRIRDNIESFLDDTATEAERSQVEQFMQKHGLDEKGLKRYSRNLQRILESELPKKRRAAEQYKAAEAESMVHVQKHFPWFKDTDSREYQDAMTVLKTLPEIKRLPHWRLTAGVYVMGLREMAKRMNAKPANGQAKTKPTPQPGKPAGGAKSDGDNRDTIRKRFMDTGDSESASQFIDQALEGVI